MKLSERIYEIAKEIWPEYLEHPFLNEMAEGSLPIEKFKFYMLEDYVYLRDYVKIFAAIIINSNDFDEIRFLSDELNDTIDETYRTHIPYMKRLGITNEDIENVKPHIQSKSYTGYMLNIAQHSDVLTGLVTLLNCSWGYAYAAQSMIKLHPHAVDNHDYGDWFKGYSCEEYIETNQSLIDRIDSLAENISEEKAGELCEIFKKCCYYDLHFWDMAYSMGK